MTMSPYNGDPYGQQRPPRQPRQPGYLAADRYYAAKRKMQGWWAAFAVTVVLGIALFAGYNASLTAPESKGGYTYDDGSGYGFATPEPTSLSYLLIAALIAVAVAGFAAVVIAVRATAECSRIKTETYGGF